MDVSSGEVEPGGQELIQKLASLTGLPEEWVRLELDQILAGQGESSRELTLEKLREAMMKYLETVQSAISLE